MESLRSIRSQIAQVKASLPPPPGRCPVMVYATRGPRPADAPADTETVKHWWYADLAELAALRGRFTAEYEDTRGPYDPPCLFFRMISQMEIFEEQYKGTKYESLWDTPPTSSEVPAS